MIGPYYKRFSEEHRLVLLEAFNDCEEFLVSCAILLLGLSKFLGPVCDRSSFLTDYSTRLVVAQVGADLKFLVKIGVMKHCIFCNDFLNCFEGLNCSFGPGYWTVFLLSFSERNDWR